MLYVDVLRGPLGVDAHRDIPQNKSTPIVLIGNRTYLCTETRLNIKRSLYVVMREQMISYLTLTHVNCLDFFIEAWVTSCDRFLELGLFTLPFHFAASSALCVRLVDEWTFYARLCCFVCG